MITIPEYLWQRLLEELSRNRSHVEQVCYLDGIATNDGGVVTTLTIPNARLLSGRFEVPPDSMSQAGKHLRGFRLRRLAQVHTHPGEWTGHSRWDDEWACSQLPGAISIVLPSFARKRPALADAGVHLHNEAGWRQLSPEEAANELRIVPSLLDFRPKFRHEHERERIEPARRRPWWKIFAFWRR